MKLTPAQWSIDMKAKLNSLQSDRSDFFLIAVEEVIPVFVDRIRVKKVDVEGNFFGKYASKKDEDKGNIKGQPINFSKTNNMLDSLNAKPQSSSANLSVVSVGTKGTKSFFAAKELTEKQGFNIFILNEFELNNLRNKAERFYSNYFFNG